MTNELFIQAKWDTGLDTLGHRIAPCPEMGKGLDREGFGCPGGVPIRGLGLCSRKQGEREAPRSNRIAEPQLRHKTAQKVRSDGGSLIKWRPLER
jgi:hypothetical protein